MVAMATYGKWEKWILTISTVSLEIFFFTDMFIGKSCKFYMTFVQIASFDWLLGRHEG